MTEAATWRGRRGSVLLGPTQDRVARYLADRTRHGRVVIASRDVAAALGLERSEAYRILRRLRTLGLFGIEDDRGGIRGGRRFWRTPTTHDGPGLNAARHRDACRRIVGWSRRRSAAIYGRLAALRNHTRTDGRYPYVRQSLEAGARGIPPVLVGAPASGAFAAAMRRYGLAAEIIDG